MNLPSRNRDRIRATAVLKSFPRRATVAAVVVGVHALGAFLLLAPRAALETQASPPIEVRLIEEVASLQIPPPLPAPRIDPPPIEAVQPEIAIALDERAAAPVAVAAAARPPSPAAISESLVGARFDADYLKNPAPAYPAVSRRLREQGVVVLRVLVRPDGTGSSVLVHRSSGYLRLDEAAISTVKAWRFAPALRGEQPVASWVLVPIEFELLG